MHKAIIAIGIAVTACLVAGCGNTGEETTQVAATKAQFVKQAEAICSRVQTEGRDARLAWEEVNGKEMNFDTTFRRIVGPALKQEAEELRSLAAPEKDKAKLTRMINNLSKGAEAFAAEGASVKSPLNFEAFQREAEAYGLEACLL